MLTTSYLNWLDTVCGQVNMRLVVASQALGLNELLSPELYISSSLDGAMLGALHKLRHTNFLFFLTPLPSLSQMVTFLRPPPSVTSHIFQFYT